METPLPARMLLLIAIVTAALLGCVRREQPPTDALASQSGSAPFEVSTSIQDIMGHVIDPAADALWNSVTTTIGVDGVQETRPHTDEEWLALRGHAITLMEAANLLIIDGRKVLLPGQVMADEGIPGILPATEVQTKIDANRAQLVQFAHLLHDTSERMLKAIDAKNVDGMLATGAEIDAACEACHMTFWYPTTRKSPN